MMVLLFMTIIIIYRNYNPIEHYWYPQCLVKLLTGWSCPACGFQRATHALLNGRITEALSYNYFYVIGVPYILLIVIGYGLKKMKKGMIMAERIENRTLAMLYVYSFFAWFIIRNILNI